MKPSLQFLRRHLWAWTLVAGFAVMLVSFPLTGANAKVAKSKNKLLDSYDIRVNGGSDGIRLLNKFSTLAAKARSRMRDRVDIMVRGAQALKDQLPDADITLSPVTGLTEVVGTKTGALTLPAPGKDGMEIVRDFLRANASVYNIDASEVDGLHFIGESDSPSGLRMVRFEQVVNGVPVFQSETRAIIDADGRLVRTLGMLVPGAGEAEPLTDLITPTTALVSAMDTVNLRLDESIMTTRTEGDDRQNIRIETRNSRISHDPTSSLVYFPLAPGVLIPAWSHVVLTNTGRDWYTLVDAKSGSLLWRKNIRADASTHDARFRVHVQADGVTPTDSPAPHSPTTNTVGLGTQYPEVAPSIVSMFTAMDASASPNGWINDCPGGGCTANETQTIGNNVHAYMDAQGGANANQPDTNAAFMLDGNGKPMGNPDANGRNRDFLGTTPRDFEGGFLPPPQGGNPEAGQTATGSGNNGTTPIDSFRRGVVTHLFYVANWYHDQLWKLGFNEAAGNFQLDNFGRGGVANDRVNAEAEDSSSTNNANFSTPPDGTSGRAQMFRFTGPTIDRDGDLDQEVLMHELTHGTSNRLIGNAHGLQWQVGGGMGEGWSDFYALSLLNNTNADDPDGLYAAGAYATYKLGGLLDNYVYGIRRFPYTTQNSVNPMTWADVDDVTNDLSGGISPSPLNFNINGAMEVHNLGEVWCLTLWEVRSRVIHDQAGANGDVPTGNHTMLQLITDALKMTPINPSLEQARDAIIATDGATHSFANEESIWGGFADRGFGYKASAPLANVFGFTAGHMGITESFSVPFLDINGLTIVDTPNGNNNAHIDPGERVNLTVKLLNPWHAASKTATGATATLTTSTAGVTIVTGSSTYGTIAPQATVSGTPFTIQLSTSGFTAGQALHFTLQVNSSLGPKSLSFIIRVGTPSGVGAPITYTKTIPSPFLAIPDNRPRGVTDTMSVSDDFEIADLNFRIDDIHHTFVGDLSVELKGPTGFGVDMASIIGGLTDGGPGDNLINMVIDDQASAQMIIATAASAPFTGSWLPIFNNPSWAGILGPGSMPDPVGSLSRFNGTSTNGTWTVEVSDQFLVDTGTLRGWSIIVTPVNFVTTVFFDTCLQDDSNPSVKFLGNALTGQYQLCACGGMTFTGTAVVTKSGNITTFQVSAADRRFTATFDKGTFRGTGSFQSPPGALKCSIIDRDTRNNTCACN